MAKPSVSVVIPNYNYARFLNDCIDSVLAQTFKDLEVLVVDNGSVDHSLAVLRAYGDRIRVVAQENRGQAGSRNRGIEEAKGEFIAFLDADDVWHPSKLEKQLPYFANPKVGLVYCGYSISDKNLNEISSCIPQLRGNVLKLFASQAGAVVQAGESTAVVRKAAFDRAGLFDPQLSISTGWDMWRRIACFYEIEVVPEVLAKYRQHGTNAHHKVDVYEKDVLLRLEKMFSDPAASTIFQMKKESYSRSFLALSGSYLHVGNLPKSILYLGKSLLESPRSLGYVAGLPVRHCRRLMSRLGI